MLCSCGVHKKQLAVPTVMGRHDILLDMPLFFAIICSLLLGLFFAITSIFMQVRTTGPFVNGDAVLEQPTSKKLSGSQITQLQLTAARFSAFPNSGHVPLAVQFFGIDMDKVDHNGGNYFIEFGDGKS